MGAIFKKRLNDKQHDLLRVMLFEYQFLKHWVCVSDREMLERVEAVGKYSFVEKARLNEVRTHWINYNK